MVRLSYGNYVARRAYRTFGLIVFCSLLSVMGSSCRANAQNSRRPPPKTERPPAIEQITEHTFRVGAALVDTRDRTVICPGEINMDEGAIEYLAVAPSGKTHESLLRIDVRPLHLQVALLMVDLEPKNVLRQQGDKNTPQGDPVELRIRWRGRDGQAHDVRAEEMVIDLETSKPMARHFWVFTGSRVLKQGFQADIEKSLIAVWHDPAAILDNPLPGGGGNAYAVNGKVAPKRGTHVDLVMRAVSPAKRASPKESAGGKL